MAQRTRSEYTVLNMASGFGGYIVNFLVGIASRMVFTRVFSAEYLGITGLFSNVLGMLSLAELGIGSAIVYALYKPIAENNKGKIASLVKFYGKCYRVIAVVVLIIGLAVIPFFDFIITDPPAVKEDLRILYLISLFNTVSGYFFAYRHSLLQAAQKTYIINITSNVIIVVQNIIQILLMLFVGEYIVYSLVIAFFSMLTNLIVAEIAKRQYPYIKGKKAEPLEKQEKKSIAANVRALTIDRIGALLVNSTDNIIITNLRGLVQTGIASNYTLLSTSINTILEIVFRSVNASVGNHNALNDTDSRLRLFKAINLANFWMYAWASIGFFVVSTDVIRLMFGESYQLPLSVAFIIALNMYMVGMQNAVWTYRNTLGLFRYGRYLVLLTAAINLVVSIALGKVWGVFGILAGSAISRALTNTWYSPYSLYKYGFGMSVKKYYLRYLGFLVLLAVTGSVCWGVCSIIEFSSLLFTVIVKIVICSVIPNVVFFAVFSKGESFGILKDFVLRFVNKITAKLKKA